MQTGVPPNLANLNQIYNKYDNNQDGLVVDSEIEQILKEVGYSDVYIGTIRKVVRLLNFPSQQNKTLNFIQVQEFANAMVTKGKFAAWKTKYKIRESIEYLHHQIYIEEPNSNGAAPGACPGGSSIPGISDKGPNSQEGEINIKAGNSQNYNQHVSITIEKQKGKQLKPFIKISVERKTNDQAKKLQTLFKQLYNRVIEIVKSEDEQLVADFLSVSLITNVQGNVFNLFVTTNNKDFNEFIELLADYLDMLLKQPVNGKISAYYKFNFLFEKFLTEPQYNFYDMIVKDSKLEIKWSLWDLFRNLRTIILNTDMLQDLTWNPQDYFGMIFIALVHTQRFTGKLEFQNTTTDNQQTTSKEMIAKFLKECKYSLQDWQNDSQLNILELVQELDGKISIEAAVKDWKFNVEANLQDFSKLLTQDVQGYN